jgi:hypothetical protein
MKSLYLSWLPESCANEHINLDDPAAQPSIPPK